ncbi:aminotransferase class V-fold PLP-dependent enzyme [Massilia sp. CF038]|uniref:aminotransferase class V-fold PLP-dependent enzyme n=1 Tax=Massilia sp. CF038 TaxID=1881045 RepID=UPI00090FDB79|nr:aminotransferase class V-fold PLP-dependent enzyme [Massilia sp. CF038]SHH69724.1 Cysteine sulfinate desulfinase/cysteine desulfurase [Massilia sp. CF038]
MMNEIYLDANATSPVLPAAIAAAEAAMREGFGNPSSSHCTGLKAKAMLAAVRARACRLLGVGDGQLTFTSGATEGIQTAVLSALCAIRERRARGEATGDLLLYGATEHKAVPETLAHWNRILGTGLELRVLPVDGYGRHQLDVLRELAPRAAMVCTMAANNETGVISDLDGIAAVLCASASPAYWMVDSVQALGKLQLDLATTRIDYAPFSGHKLYAPKGIGMLYVRRGAPYTPLMCGGGQEAGQRAGTENMAGVAALGAVLEALEAGGVLRTHEELFDFRARLADALRAALPGIVFNAPFGNALATTLNFSVPGFSSKELLDLFDAAGVRVSAGSACSSAKAAPSYVLEAMHLPHWRCAAAVRMSFGPMADQAFIDAACARIAHCGEALRKTCLIPSAGQGETSDGIVQLSVDGASSWLIFDAASASCAVIDPLAPLAPRIADLIRCQNVQVRAVLDTGADGSGRAALLPLLEGHLAMASTASAMLGQQILVPAPHSDGLAYLFGDAAADGTLPAQAVRFAFVGSALALDLGGLVNESTIVCGAHDTGAVSTYAGAGNEAETRWHGLDESALDAFLSAHPAAMLIDVREPFEHVAAGAGTWHGRPACSVPLSRLADRVGEWLRSDQRPLVFFCRSGARSEKAARCLQRLGYRNAYHVAGNLSLN